MKNVWFCLILASTLNLGGCSSIMNDKVQPVSVETPGCPGATCKLSNADGNYFINKTPGTVMVNKAYGDLTVECSKDGE